MSSNDQTDRVFQMREGLLAIEMSGAKNAGYEERAGNYAVALVHRRYAHLCKSVRLGLPAQDLFTTTTQRKGMQP
jgi:hypothetical protein